MTKDNDRAQGERSPGLASDHLRSGGETAEQHSVYAPGERCNGAWYSGISIFSGEGKIVALRSDFRTETMPAWRKAAHHSRRSRLIARTGFSQFFQRVATQAGLDYSGFRPRGCASLRLVADPDGFAFFFALYMPVLAPDAVALPRFFLAVPFLDLPVLCGGLAIARFRPEGTRGFNFPASAAEFEDAAS